MPRPTAKKTAATAAHNGQGQVRIIAGEWRSRRLPVPNGEGLRPTPDRVRETLFNWLQAWIEGARVLDAFAGSGAVFLEALSRGATGLALDTNPQALQSLRTNLGTLKAGDIGQTRATSALEFLRQPADQRFDVVFLDPPFNQGLLQPTCQLLEANGWLNDNAWIYTESETAPSQLGLPTNWELHREKKTGVVYYSLWRRIA